MNKREIIKKINEIDEKVEKINEIEEQIEIVKRIMENDIIWTDSQIETSGIHCYIFKNLYYIYKYEIHEIKMDIGRILETKKLSKSQYLVKAYDVNDTDYILDMEKQTIVKVEEIEQLNDLLNKNKN